MTEERFKGTKRLRSINAALPMQELLVGQRNKTHEPFFWYYPITPDQKAYLLQTRFEKLGTIVKLRLVCLRNSTIMSLEIKPKDCTSMRFQGYQEAYMDHFVGLASFEGENAIPFSLKETCLRIAADDLSKAEVENFMNKQFENGLRMIDDYLIEQGFKPDNARK